MKQTINPKLLNPNQPVQIKIGRNFIAETASALDREFFTVKVPETEFLGFDLMVFDDLQGISFLASSDDFCDVDETPILINQEGRQYIAKTAINLLHDKYTIFCEGDDFLKNAELIKEHFRVHGARNVDGSGIFISENKISLEVVDVCDVKDL